MDLYIAYLRLLVALPLVMLLAYWGLRFLLPRFVPVWYLGKKVQVVERMALHSRAFLYVIKVGEEYFLLAATHTHVSLLKDLGRSWAEDSALTEMGSASRKPEPLNWGNFAGLLEKLKAKGNQWKGPDSQG